ATSGWRRGVPGGMARARIADSLALQGRHGMSVSPHHRESAAAGERTVASVCCYCGTGCGVRVTAKDGRVIAVQGDPEHPANRGRLCSKGLALADTVRRDTARVLQAEWRPERGRERMPV